MQQFEKDLTTILHRYQTICLNNFRSDDFNIPEIQLRELAARNLIAIQPFSFGDPAFKVTLTDAGILYFQKKAQEQIEVKKESRRYRITTSLAAIGAITGIASLIWLIWSTLCQVH